MELRGGRGAGFPPAPRDTRKMPVPPPVATPARQNVLGTPVGVQTSIALRRTPLHLLTTVEADISSSAIRRLASEGNSLSGMVPDAVADYIQKLHLFLNEK